MKNLLAVDAIYSYIYDSKSLVLKLHKGILDQHSHQVRNQLKIEISTEFNKLGRNQALKFEF